MTVLVRYQGRFGNLLFQYVYARLFAEDNGLRFCTPTFEQDLVTILEPKAGLEKEGPVVSMTDDSPDIHKRKWGPAKYVFDGYFQWSDFYLTRRSLIEAFIKPRPLGDLNFDDIVINLRVGEDYRKLGWVIDPGWYLEILSRENFRRLHIVCDTPDQRYLDKFRKYSPIVISTGAKGDWEYLRKFDRIVCSNSTFCWWAAFFSRARKIYTFKKWIPYPTVKIGVFPGGEACDGVYLTGSDR